MKTKNDRNELVTRGMLDEALVKFGTDFEKRLDKKLDEKITNAVDGLAIMIEKGFAAVAKDIAAINARIDRLEERLDAFEKRTNERVEMVFAELKEIRTEIRMDRQKTKAEIDALDFRVSRLEKKAGL